MARCHRFLVVYGEVTSRGQIDCAASVCAQEKPRRVEINDTAISCPMGISRNVFWLEVMVMRYSIQRHKAIGRSGSAAFVVVLALVVLTIVGGSVLFALRQRRLQLMHDVTQLHSQIRHDRQRLWNLQVQIAKQTKPDRLHQAITHTGLEVEPITPAAGNGRPVPLLTAAEPDHHVR